MEFHDVIRARRSVRAYRSTPVPDAVLPRLWEAVRWAPSACNYQPWRFLLLRSAEARGRLAPFLKPWTASAPLLVAALGNRHTAWRRDGRSSHELDVAIALEHLVLAAAAEGLGTCWICAFDRAGVEAALGQGPEWDPVALTPLGYPDDPSPRNPRKPLTEILTTL